MQRAASLAVFLRGVARNHALRIRATSRPASTTADDSAATGAAQDTDVAR